jgi:hypothetical protein
VRPFWAKRIYPASRPTQQGTAAQPNASGEQADNNEKEFEEWHTAMQYIEMIQFIAAGGRRRSSTTNE